MLLTASARVTATEISDRDLLWQFRGGDQTAFAALVERHQGLVYRVSRRILSCDADCEDAFQATFLVLARRAKALAWQESIAGWLLVTARRASLKLRGQIRRRTEVEQQAAVADCASEKTEPKPSDLNELATILDEELSGLPDRFREVILLTQVEGLSRDEVAKRTGLSVAAVKDRLERGRTQLRARLVRRGVTLSATALAVWLVPVSAQAAGGGALVAATTQSAALFASGGLTTGVVPASVTLAQGVLKMTGLEQIRSLLVAAVTVLTAGTIAYGMLRDEPHRFEKGLVGQIVEVNRNGTTPTVTIRLEEFDTLLNLDVAANARVWEAFEPAKLEDVRTGRLASLRLAADHRKVAEIHLQGAVREVTIRSVTDSGRITFVDTEDDEEEPKAPQAADLAADAILRIGGLPAGRTELKPGMEIPLEFSSDGQRINAVETQAEDGLLAWGELVEGLNSSNQIRFRGEDGDDVEREMHLTITAETLVTLDGKPAKIADVPVGSELVIRRGADKSTAAAIQAKRPEAEADDK